MNRRSFGKLLAAFPLAGKPLWANERVPHKKPERVSGVIPYGCYVRVNGVDLSEYVIRVEVRAYNDAPLYTLWLEAEFGEAVPIYFDRKAYYIEYGTDQYNIFGFRAGLVNVQIIAGIYKCVWCATGRHTSEV